MPVEDFHLSVVYLRQVAEQIHRIGGDVGAWLAASRLSEDELADASLIVPFPVLQQLIQDALHITNEPALGLLVGDRLGVNSHGILGYAAMSSGSIRQTLELFETYLRVRTTLLLLRHEVHGDTVQVMFVEPQPLGNIRRPVLEAVMLTVKNLLDQITMGSCLVEEVAFPFATPAYAALARDLFKCEVRYAQPRAGFALPLSVIDQPLKMTDPATFQDALQICRRELDKLTRDQSLAAQVRRILLEKQGGFPSLSVMAQLFHLTPRTLHRRLLEEGTSFKAILEDVRHLLAVEHLKAGGLSIQEIAYTLGYTDMANFRRAFKRWEGIAPSEYRGINSR